jgi:hypothetical protein
MRTVFATLSSATARTSQRTQLGSHGVTHVRCCGQEDEIKLRWRSQLKLFDGVDIVTVFRWSVGSLQQCRDISFDSVDSACAAWTALCAVHAAQRSPLSKFAVSLVSVVLGSVVRFPFAR